MAIEMQILNGKIIAESLKTELIQQRKKIFGDEEKYLAIIMVGENNPCKVYVRNKIKFAEEIGLRGKIIGQEKEDWTTEEMIKEIKNLNTDPDCIGIIIQMPLSEKLKKDKDLLCASVHPLKDIDGLGGFINGLHQIWICHFLPATVKAVFNLLEYYDLDHLRDKNIAVIGRGNVIGKPFAMECVRKGAKVRMFSTDDTPEQIRNHCQNADIIVACTGVCHLVDDTYLNASWNQILIDVGYGSVDGKPAWDIYFQKVEGKVQAISPVPWGIWPLTIASLFQNLFLLQEQKEIIKTVIQHLFWN